MNVLPRAEFESLLRKFLDEGLDLARQRAEGKPIPQRDRITVVERPDGTFEDIDVVQDAATGLITRDVYEDVCHLPSYAPLAAACRDLPDFQGLAQEIRSDKVLSDDERLDHAIDFKLRFLIDQFCARHALVVDEDAWPSRFDDLWLAWKESSRWATTLAPVHGLRVTEPIPMGELTLRAQSQEERDFLANMPGISRRPFPGGAHHAHAVLEHSVFIRGGKNEGQSPTRVITTALLALRLWVAEPLVLSVVRSGNGVTFGPPAPNHSRTVPLPDPNGFAEYWTRARIALASPPEGLDIALRRFSLMHDQPRAADRILDQMIILEALFNEGGTELAYRLSVAVAQFLEGDADSRAQTFKTVKAAYGFRSKIAHGAPPKSSDQDLQARMDAMTREVLRRYTLLAASDPAPNLRSKVIDELHRKTLCA